MKEEVWKMKEGKKKQHQQQQFVVVVAVVVSRKKKENDTRQKVEVKRAPGIGTGYIKRDMM